MTFAAYASSIFPEGLSENLRFVAALLILLTGVHADQRQKQQRHPGNFYPLKIGVILAFVLGTLIAVDYTTASEFPARRGRFRNNHQRRLCCGTHLRVLCLHGMERSNLSQQRTRRSRADASRDFDLGTGVVTLFTSGSIFLFHVAPMELLAGQVEV